MTPFDKWVLVMLVGIPVSALVIFFVTAPTRERSWQEREIARFAGRFGISAVRSLPGELARGLRGLTDGEPERHLVFHKNAAYLTVVRSNAVEASDSLHVMMKLEEPGPQMFVRPVPVVDGKKERPKGAIVFQKDPEFTEEFVVEGPNPKAIGRFLSSHVRDLLMELPRAFLRVQGKTMSFSAYGRADQHEIEQLVRAAEELFVEYGAKGGRALLPEELPEAERLPPVKKAKAKLVAKPA